MVCDLLELGSEEFDRFKRKLCKNKRCYASAIGVGCGKNWHPAMRFQTSDLAMCWSDATEMGRREVVK